MPFNDDKPVLSDLNKITEDMMGPGRSRDHRIYVDPHVTPEFVKNPKTRTIPNFPIIYEIAKDTYQINEFGMANFYVLIGEERGLAVDCGCGSIDAKSIIEHLCTKPYDVAITHAHGDHCGAMCQFDKVWLFPQDIPLVHDDFRVNQQLWENPNIWRSGPATWPDGTKNEYNGSRLGSKDFYDFSNLTFMGIDQNNLPEILPMEDEQVFHLGGRDVTVLHVPGHSPGCCVFVDPATRIMFSGDAIHSSFDLRGHTAEEAVEILEKIKRYKPQFDRMFPGHTAIGYNTANFSENPELLDDALMAYKSIVDGTAVYEERELFGGRKTKVAVYGKATVGLEKPQL